MQSPQTKTVTIGELRDQLRYLLSLPDEARVFFGSGDLTFMRFKHRGPVDGPALVQVEFGELYQIVDDGQG
jgi:hypothetical protein